MCKENKVCVFLFLLGLLLCSAWGALHGQEQEQWYLITESELRSIEDSRTNSAAEKQNWLSQVSELQTRARSLSWESALLNDQLRQERELSRKLTQSFNEYEAAQSLQMSQKDTRITILETESKGKDRTIVRLIMAIAAMGLGIVIPMAVKIVRKFRVA
jgi:predicted nuclease with TOPRIM domain